MYYFLAILFAAAPSYVWRFSIFGLPANFLEILSVLFLIAFKLWLWRKNLIGDYWRFLKKQPKLFLSSICLFLLAGIISAAISPNHSRALGLLLVWFILPIATFFPAAYILANPINKARFIKWLFVIIGIASLYAIIQYFSLLGLPKEWWGNSSEPKRALSFFEYPNAYALFLAPLLAFLLPFLSQKNIKAAYKFCYLLGLLGLLLSLSRGGWLGLGAAALVFALFFAEKKIRKFTFIAALLVALVVAIFPNLRYRVILPFEGEKSAVSRFSLWQTADKMLADSPLLGKGLYGYKSYFDQYNTDPNLASINFPHLIFLNFWVEAGLLGLLSFLAICAITFWRAYKAKGLIATGIILFLIAIFAHGLVDAPYLKNDLALVFWVIIALL